ncbi:hypothetical protein GOP47_0010752 [Adiantum capillus-veneris]|uniref:Uncharacterized protein n=1 Tax=Adiantum capillus-veneris TaxID=13818 RepID=A0A9D4UVP7_ADICA|nr:hypothetical protein GOP47_0010752 [Adiantum capillus-veneris]
MSSTRVSPNKKDVCRKRIGRNSYVKHPVHLLEQSQVELFLNFKEQYPEIVISQLTIFVHITYFRIAEWLKKFGLNIRRHWVWSDGAASQFKARRPFYFLARYSVFTRWKMS